MAKRRSVSIEWTPEQSAGEQVEITVGDDPVGYLSEHSAELAVWVRIGNAAGAFSTPREVASLVSDLNAAARILEKRIKRACSKPEASEKAEGGGK